jgi:hypothetical protein
VGGLRPLVGYLLRAALGERLFVGLAGTLLLCAALAVFLGGTVLVEQREFAAVLTASAARLAVVLALVLFTCFHIRRAFESREVDLLLSRPVSRADFVLAHALMLVLCAALMAALAGLAVAAIARPALAAWGWWTLSVFLEATIAALAALFFALTLRSGVASVLACLGLYLLGRMVGLLAGIAAAQSADGPLERALDHLVGLLALILPRLDLLGRGAWLVHGVADSGALLVALLQGALYAVVLAAAASLDFHRRQL